MEAKLIIALCAFTLLSSKLYAQKVYIKAYGSYGFLSPGSYKPGVSRPVSSDTSLFSVSKKGMGEGVRAGAGFGVGLNDYVNIGVDGEYLKGNTLKNSINRAIENTTVNSVTTLDYSIVSIIPNITFETVSNSDYTFYNRLGIVIGIPVKITEDYNDKFTNTTPDNQQVITTTYHAIYQLKNGIGYQASIGVQREITNRLRCFLELSGYSLSLNRVRYEETERYSIESNKTPAQPLPIANRPDKSRNIIEYKDEGSTGYVRNGTENKYIYTHTYPQDPVNINAITVSAGITFKF